MYVQRQGDIKKQDLILVCKTLERCFEIQADDFDILRFLKIEMMARRSTREKEKTFSEVTFGLFCRGQSAGQVSRVAR